MPCSWRWRCSCSPSWRPAPNTSLIFSLILLIVALNSQTRERISFKMVLKRGLRAKDLPRLAALCLISCFAACGWVLGHFREDDRKKLNLLLNRFIGFKKITLSILNPFLRFKGDGKQAEYSWSSSAG